MCAKPYRILIILKEDDDRFWIDNEFTYINDRYTKVVSLESVHLTKVEETLC